MRIIQNVVRHIIIAVGLRHLHVLIAAASVLLLAAFTLMTQATDLSAILRVSFYDCFLILILMISSFLRVSDVLDVAGSMFIYRSIRLRFLSLVLVMICFTHSCFNFLTGLR